LAPVKRLLLVLIALIAVSAYSWWSYRARLHTSPAAVSAGRRLNVILITIDTLRADRLRRGFTPAIDALADAGARFVNARTAVPLTLPSHVTILTGTLPPVHGVRDNGFTFKPGPLTLARVLHDAGYRTGAFVGAYVLNHVFGLADGFDTYDDRVHRNPALGPQLEAERPGSEVADAAIEWLGKPSQPFFMWAHFYDPHAPYHPPAEFMAKAGGHAYDGEVAYADAQVGRIVSAIRDRGLAGSTIVALAGDHGEGLGDHGEQSHGMLLYDSTLRVPLVVVAPGRTNPETLDGSASLADLAGSLLTLAGLKPAPLMSKSLLLSREPGSRPRASDVYSETEYPRAAGWHALAALTDDRWKLILSSEAELYDVSVDPGETQNLASSKDTLVEGPIEAMTRRIRELSQLRSPRAEGIAPEAAERLRALGYVSGSTQVTNGSDEGPNPARIIDAWNTFEKALSAVTAGRAADALPVLRDLTARFPASRVFRSTYARALKDTGNARAAVSAYKTALARWPGEASLYHDLAVAARAAGDAKEAMRAEQAALTVDKESPAALNGLGLLQAESGAAADAAASFERAVARDPSNASYWTNLGNARRELGDLDRADRAYRKALEADAAYADAANGLGVILVQRQRPGEAIPFFQQALTRDPALHEARLNLGIAYQKSGDAAKAAETYRQILSFAPPASRERQAAEALLKGVRSQESGGRR
jgi:arylsulfatase A-like enzyme/tetratricopeptide (TPR) repeat protein